MLTRQIIDDVVRAALVEDAPWGDLTAELLIPETATATARLVAREPGIFAGGAVFAAAMTLTDPTIAVDLHGADGDAFAAGDTLATVSGPARAVLQARAGGTEPRAADARDRDADRALRRRRSPAPVPASSTRARRRRACARSNGTRCARAAGTTTASRCRTR